VKFVGVGENMTPSNHFYPDRVAQRILGMGDVLSLIEEVPVEGRPIGGGRAAQEAAEREFTLDDFRSQLRQVKKLGSFSKIMKLLPDQLLGGMGNAAVDDEQSKLMERE